MHIMLALRNCRMGISVNSDTVWYAVSHRNAASDSFATKHAFHLCLRPCRQELSATACLLAVATVVEQTVFVMAAVDMTAQVNEALVAAVRGTVTAAEAVTSRLTVMVSWAV